MSGKPPFLASCINGSISIQSIFRNSVRLPRNQALQFSSALSSPWVPSSFHALLFVQWMSHLSQTHPPRSFFFWKKPGKTRTSGTGVRTWWKTPVGPLHVRLNFKSKRLKRVEHPSPAVANPRPSGAASDARPVGVAFLCQRSSEMYSAASDCHGAAWGWGWAVRTAASRSLHPQQPTVT